MNLKNITLLAKISIILLIVLSCIHTYNSLNKNWDIYGIPFTYINIVNTIGLILLFIYFNAFSVKEHKILNFKSILSIAFIGGMLYSIIPISYLIQSIEFFTRGASILGIIPNIIYTISGLVLVLSIKKMGVSNSINYKNPVKFNNSFKLGLISSILGLIYSIYRTYNSFMGWNNNRNSDDIQYFETLGLPTFTILLLQLFGFILLLLFFIKASKKTQQINDFFKSKSFEKNTVTDQNVKPKSIKSIILSALLLAAFFMPWVKVFGFGGSAFDLIKEVVKNIKILDKEPMGILLFLLLLFPTCSLIILGNYSKRQLKSSQMNILKFAKKTPLVLILITIIVAIIKLPKGSGSFKFEDLGNIFEIIGIGLIITLITSLILFFDKTTTISKPHNEINLKEGATNEN